MFPARDLFSQSAEQASQEAANQVMNSYSFLFSSQHTITHVPCLSTTILCFTQPFSFSSQPWPETTPTETTTAPRWQIQTAQEETESRSQIEKLGKLHSMHLRHPLLLPVSHIPCGLSARKLHFVSKIA